MKKIWKTRWLKALRSGEYQQGKEKLSRHGEFCCLGVLRDVKDPEDKRCSKAEGDQFNSFLSSTQLAEVGLTREQQEKLADMNDQGKSFLQIAFYIEKHV